MSQLQDKQNAQRKQSQTVTAERAIDRAAGKLTENDFISRVRLPPRFNVDRPVTAPSVNSSGNPYGGPSVAAKPSLEIDQSKTADGQGFSSQTKESTPVERSVVPGEALVRDPGEELKVDANDMAAIRSARGEMVRQVAQELMGIGPGFSAGEIVYTNTAENNAAIDPVTKLPFDLRRVATEQQKAEIAKGLRTGGWKQGREKGNGEKAVDGSKEVRTRQADGKTEAAPHRENPLQREGASQSDRDGRKPNRNGELAQLRTPPTGTVDTSGIMFSRTIEGGSQLKPETRFEITDPNQALSSTLRDSLMEADQLHVASVALGHESAARVLGGDERALFHGQWLQTAADRLAIEQSRDTDRERARIGLQLKQQRADVEKDLKVLNKKAPAPKANSFVIMERWRSRYASTDGESVMQGVPRSAQMVRDMQRKKRNKVNLIFAAGFMALLLLLLALNDGSDDLFAESSSDANLSQTNDPLAPTPSDIVPVP